MAMFVKVTPLPEEDLYQLDNGVVVEGVYVKAGFKWNGASIPRVLWSTVGSPFQPKFMAPSMVHDYLYSIGDKSGLNRRQADKLFKKLLLANGVEESLAETMYSAVRVGGASHYADYNKEE